MAFIPGRLLTLTIGAKTYPVTDSSHSRKAEKIDVTNTKGGGYEQFIFGVKSATVSGTVVVDDADRTLMVEGSKVAATWGVTGGTVLSGTFGFESLDEKGGARGAYTVAFQGQFDGAYTVT